MSISSQQYAQSLFEVLDGKSIEDIKTEIHNFALILVKEHDLGRSSEIIENFQKLWDQKHGELSAELISARQLVPAVKEMLTSYLKTKTGSLKINLQEKINSDLLGGFILKYNSLVLNGSLRHSLENLKNKISN